MAGRKSTAAMELAIGATIIAGAILLIVMLMAWGSSSSILGRHYRVVVNMTNVGGLKEGAPVKLGGFQIGRVASIQIRPGRTDMEIVLDIDEDRLLPKDSTAKVTTAGLVGDAFMEIIPGKTTETLKRADTVAEAERIESSPLPDISDTLTKLNALGDQVNILVANLNDIIGDNQFRQSVKSLAVNMDDATYQANLILQRGRGVVDHIETATKNIADLTGTLHDRIDEVTADIRVVTGKMVDISDRVRDAADRASVLIDKAASAVDNIDGGVSEARGDLKKLSENLNSALADIRDAIGNTIGDPALAADLRNVVKNVNVVTEGLADRRGDIDAMLANLGGLSDDLRKIAARVGEITDKVEPSVVSDTVTRLNAAIVSMTDVVERIKAEPVLALSVNKAADRIVKMKFDEMAKSGHYRSADDTLREINRWVQENMRRGYFQDPSYTYGERPYTFK